MTYKQRSMRGDTILEVLIAIAVVSSILGSVFVLANRTTQNSRQAQEHQEALKYASSQIELLNEYMRQSGGNRPTSSSFCMQQTVLQPYEYTGAAPTQCQYDTGSYKYSFKISYDATNKVYIVTVMWPGATGGNDTISLAYRANLSGGMYGESIVVVPTPAPSPSPSPSPSPTPPPPPPACANPRDIVLVLDTSSSMYLNEMSPGYNRLQAMRDAANLFVDNSSVMASGNHEAIVAFNNSSAIMQPLTSSISALHTGVTAAYNYASAGTVYVGAMQRGMEALAGPGSRPGVQKVMVFMSDGLPNDTNDDDTSITGINAQMALNMANTVKSSGIVLYTVGITTDTGGTNIVLQSMIGNGGTYSAATDNAQFQAIFQALGATLDCT